MSHWGPYTAWRTRKDGTHVFFQHFHANLRPKGFPATFNLYAQEQPGPITPEERELILQRAMVNYREFCAQREAQCPMAPPSVGDMPQNGWTELIERVMDSFWFDGLSEHSRNLYGREYRKIASAFHGKPELDPSVITQGQIEQWLRRRGYSSHTIITWGVIFNGLLRRAFEDGLRPQHQPIRLRVQRAPVGPIRIWEQEDVDLVVRTFEEKGDPITSELIQVAFATGARLGDIRQLRFDVNYRDGKLDFLTNKTGKAIVLPLPDALRERLDARHRPGALMFPSPRSRPFTIGHLSEYFRESTAHLQWDVPLKLRSLRHSAVLNFARAGCTIPQIASVTGHSLVTVHTILERYLPRDPVLAAQALALRAEAANHVNLNPKVEGSVRASINPMLLPQKPTAGPQRRCA